MPDFDQDRDQGQAAEDLAQAEAEHRAARLIRIAILLFAAVLLLAVVLSIQLSTMGLNFGTLVYGTNPLWRGHSATFRIGALDPQTSRMVKDTHATLTLHDETGPRVKDTGTNLELELELELELVELTIDVPANLGQEPELRVVVENELGVDEVRFPLRARDAPGPMLARVASHREALIEKSPEPTGDWRIALYPTTGAAVAGLENLIKGRLTFKDRAKRAGLRCREVGLDTQTDDDGLFSFTYRPPLKPQAISFEIATPEQNGTTDITKVDVPLDFRPGQLRLTVDPPTFAKPGDTIDIRIHTLPFRNPIHVDAWLGDVLFIGTTAPAERGVRSFTLTLPTDARGLLRIEAYRSLWSPAGNLSNRTLWVSPEPPEAATLEVLAALRALDGQEEALLAAATDPPKASLVDLALTRVVATRPGMVLLRSNLLERQASIEDEVRRIRGHVHTFFAFTLILGLAVVIAWIIRHQLRVRRTVRATMQEGIEAGEAIDANAVQGLIRFRQAYDLALAFGAVLLLVYGLWLMLTRITWF